MAGRRFSAARGAIAVGGLSCGGGPRWPVGGGGRVYAAVEGGRRAAAGQEVILSEGAAKRGSQGGVHDAADGAGGGGHGCEDIEQIGNIQAESFGNVAAVRRGGQAV
jgi:hypothetical protein